MSSKKTKLVTSSYAYHSGPPFWGQANRERWYKYSIASICNMGVDVICYTDERERGLSDLLELKERFNLTNLTIKVHNLENNPWHERVYDLKINKHPEIYNNPNNFRYRHSSEMYWSKFMFLQNELESDINLYWIDGGLSHNGLFPMEASSYSDDPDYAKQYPGQVYSEIEYRYYYYDRAFNPETLARINAYQDDKIINICRYGITDNNMHLFSEKIKDMSQLGTIHYPVGGFFGGNSNLIQEYVNTTFEVVEKVLDSGDYVCTDQEVMWYVNSIKPQLFKNYSFDTFYHEDWKEVFQSGQVSLSHFFRKPLN